MAIYDKSNAIDYVDYSRFNKSYAQKVINACGTKCRQQAGQELLNYLCDKYKIARIPLVVTDKPRSQRGRITIYGFYRHIGNYGVSITIYNTTPSTHKEVAPKTFLNTLCHEFIHHYDYQYLKLNGSLHTTGFYKRISDLLTKIK